MQVYIIWLHLRCWVLRCSPFSPLHPPSPPPQKRAELELKARDIELGQLKGELGAATSNRWGGGVRAFWRVSLVVLWIRVAGRAGFICHVWAKATGR